MKRLFVLLLFFPTITLIYSQNKDSVIYTSENITIIKNIKSKRFTIHSKTTRLEKLKFVQLIVDNFQVLDDNNNVFYVTKTGEVNEKENNFYLCGTVPHYTLSVILKNDLYEIYEDETFYDSGNKIPSKKIMDIPKNRADEILFINGQNSFNFTENFGILSTGNVNPRMIILKKDSYFTTLENPERSYDEIVFTNYEDILVTKKGDLYGILNSFEPKYKNISRFNYYLAEATLPNGNKIFIDINGNEY